MPEDMDTVQIHLSGIHTFGRLPLPYTDIILTYWEKNKENIKATVNCFLGIFVFRPASSMGKGAMV